MGSGDSAGNGRRGRGRRPTIKQGRRKEASKLLYSTSSSSSDLQDDTHGSNHQQQRLEAQQSQSQSQEPSLLEEVDEEGEEPISDIDTLRRRRVVQGILAASATVAMSLPITAARAGIPEMDRSGLLFSPKSEMLAGGTEAARGISLSRSSNQRSRSTLTEGQAFQTVYETRFIAYLSRFLLNFDPAVNAWWQNQGLGESWEEQLLPGEKNDVRRDYSERTFAEFAEAVEIGLADYFVGPYGSYSSLAAAKAGILAAQPALSVQLVSAVPQRRARTRATTNETTTHSHPASTATSAHPSHPPGPAADCRAPFH